MATHTVTLTTDSGTTGFPGELRSAINDASAGDTIDIRVPAKATINLTLGTITVNKTLFINGNHTAVAGTQIIATNQDSPIFLFQSGAELATLTVNDDTNTNKLQLESSIMFGNAPAIRVTCNMVPAGGSTMPSFDVGAKTGTNLDLYLLVIKMFGFGVEITGAAANCRIKGIMVESTGADIDGIYIDGATATAYIENSKFGTGSGVPNGILFKNKASGTLEFCQIHAYTVAVDFEMKPTDSSAVFNCKIASKVGNLGIRIQQGGTFSIQGNFFGTLAPISGLLGTCILAEKDTVLTSVFLNEFANASIGLHVKCGADDLSAVIQKNRFNLNTSGGQIGMGMQKGIWIQKDGAGGGTHTFTINTTNEFAGCDVVEAACIFVETGSGTIQNCFFGTNGAQAFTYQNVDGIVMQTDGAEGSWTVSNNVILKCTRHGIHVKHNMAGSITNNFLGAPSAGSLTGTGNQNGIALETNGSPPVNDNVIGYNVRGIYVIIAFSGTILRNLIGITSTAAIVGNSFGVVWQAGTGTFGGASVVDRNVVSNSTSTGIALIGSATPTITNNYIGTDTFGALSAPNKDGISLDTTGFGAIGPGNVISGNTMDGIVGEKTYAGTISGNYIGVTASGTARLANRTGFYWKDGSATMNNNVVSGNQIYGFFMPSAGAGTINLTITNNKIGTNAAGTAAVENGWGTTPAFGAGVYAQTGTLTIGTNGTGNTISGNNGDGVKLLGNANATLKSNIVGLNESGDAAIANVRHGVSVAESTDVTIGGTAATTEGNIISGNGERGVDISTAHAINLYNNKIGTNAAGDAARPNAMEGIFASNATLNVGTNGAGNLISGNTGNGIGVSVSVTSTVKSNFVGTNAAGTAALPNGAGGMRIASGITHTIGGTGGTAGMGTSDGNLISGNGNYGICFAEGVVATMQGNYVGTDKTGTLAVPNPDGVQLTNTSGTVTVGGVSAGPEPMAQQTRPNVVSGNSDTGIFVNTSGTGMAVIQNNIVGGNPTLTGAVSNVTNGITVDPSDEVRTTVGVASHTTGYWGGRNMVTGTSSGSLLSSTTTLQNCVDPDPATVALCGADPHAVCLDRTRIDVYHPGFYRFFSDEEGTVANLEVRRRDVRGRDYAHAIWLRWVDSLTGQIEEETHTFVGPVFDSRVDGEHASLERTVHVAEKALTFVLEGEFNTVGMRIAGAGMYAKCNGLMAGQLLPVSDIESTECVGEPRLVALCERKRNALVCGSKNPHMVSFFGATIPSPKQIGGVELLTVADNGAENVYAAHGMFLDHHVKEVKVSQNGSVVARFAFGENRMRFSDLRDQTARATETGPTGVLEWAIGPLFVRAQSCGAISFAVEEGNFSGMAGLLATTLAEAKMDGNKKSGVKKHDGLYAKLVEPHLLSVE